MARVAQRRHPDPGRRFAAGRDVRLPPAEPRPCECRASDGRAPAGRCRSSGRRGSSCRCSSCPAGARVFARERWTGAPLIAGLTPRRGRGTVGRRLARRARLRAFPLPAAGALRSRTGAAVPLVAPVGVLRFRRIGARRSGLLRRALAQGRNRRAARGRLALLRARSRSATRYLRS